MNQTVKFPDMRPPKDRGASTVKLPTPEGYRQRIPLFPTSDGNTQNRRIERKRLILWLGAAVALHAALLLGFWLTPPLRLKWGPASDAWVQVTSLPKKAPEAPLVDAPEASGVPNGLKPGTTDAKPDPKKPSHKPRPAAEPEKPQRN